MKLWARFSKRIFKLVVDFQLEKLHSKLLETVLHQSTQLLDPLMMDEMRSFIVNQQTPDGGFADRAGESDLYYTLFGYYLAETLSVTTVNDRLAQYVSKIVSAGALSGVYQYCGAILYAKLIGLDEHTEKLHRQIVIDLNHPRPNQSEYSLFLGILALYYLEDYSGIRKVIKKSSKSFTLIDHPCPVMAASAIIFGITGIQTIDADKALLRFHHPYGGFTTLRGAPMADMLSTGVALYALHFLDADLRHIKPDCLQFVDDLYDHGGFRAIATDPLVDVEYTFYGLLALGSMNKQMDKEIWLNK